jgi:peptidoglycan/LPS O-acetylase OafA/YrhL
MTTPEPAARYHALDCLRGFAMFLGVALHAALSLTEPAAPFWPVRDAHPTPAAPLFLVAVHDFRMQLFFLLAGFFAGLLTCRYGLRGMAWHRVKRVAVPFALALALVVPTVLAAGLYAEVENVRGGPVRGEPSAARAWAAELVAADPDAATGRVVAGACLSGDLFRRILPLHLWFLYYLLVFYAAALLLVPLLGRLSGTRLLAAVDAAFRRVVAGPTRVLVPAALTLPLMLAMNWVVDTPTDWRIPPHVLGYYAGFFLFGWVLYRHRDLVPAFGRGWGFNLVAANLLVFPAMVGLVATGAEAERAGQDVTGFRVGAAAASVLYTWLMVTGLWGAFLRLFARESRWGRYLADASYWCYLASITPVVVLQFWVRDWDVPGVLKLAFVTAAATAVLLASYEWLVRYTAVGAVLNGRKYRTAGRAAAAPAAPAGLVPAGRDGS